MELNVITISIAFLLLFLYVGQILWYGIYKVKNNPQTDCSPEDLQIIIPFRNEEEQLPGLFNSLIQVPKNVRIYWIDDHSTDSGKNWLIQNLPPHHCLLTNQGEGKKAAIQTGINALDANRWILTLDADIQLNEDWWESIKHQFDQHLAMIVFPISMEGGNNWIERFQKMEFSFFQILTQGSILRQRPQFCNGAHLAFQKKYFDLVNGYNNNKHISSGDDQFLMAEFRKAQLPIGWSSIDAKTISIFPLKKWSDLIRQRVRWASKTPALKMWDMKCLAIFTALANTLTFFIIIDFIAHPHLSPRFNSLLLVPFIKWGVEYCVFYKNKKNQYVFTILFLIIYPIWVVMVGIWALFLKQEWKGRPIKR